MTNHQQSENDRQAINTTSSPCVAVVTDMLFASKIQSAARFAGRPCSTVRTLDELEVALNQSAISCVFVDMAIDKNLSADAIQFAKQKQPSSVVIAFYAHVDTQLGQLATASGADQVMTRSQFVAALPKVVAR